MFVQHNTEGSNSDLPYRQHPSGTFERTVIARQVGEREIDHHRRAGSQHQSREHNVFCMPGVHCLCCREDRVLHCYAGVLSDQCSQPKDKREGDDAGEHMSVHTHTRKNGQHHAPGPFRSVNIHIVAVVGPPSIPGRQGLKGCICSWNRRHCDNGPHESGAEHVGVKSLDLYHALFGISEH